MAADTTRLEGARGNTVMAGSYDAEVEFVSGLLTAAVLERDPNLANGAAAADDLVRDLTRAIGRATTAGVINALADRVTADAVAAGFVVERRPVVPYMTLFGTIDVCSPYLQGPEGGARPVKDRLGIVGRAKSPAVERALIDFGIEESFGQASKRFEEHYGFKVGRTSILRVVEGAGREAEVFVAERLAAEPEGQPEPPDVVVVELDGCEIRTATLDPRNDGTLSPIRKLPRKQRVERWRDVRVGFTGRHGDDDTMYIAKMAGYPEVVADLHRAADQMGAREANLIVAPIDGGIGLREAITVEFPDVQIILDWGHCRSHLFATAAEMQLDDADRTETVEFWTSRLNDGEAVEFITDLHRYASHVPAPPAAQRVERLANHLHRFHDAVDYQRFRDLGWPIGSGRVEAAHRIIPQKRLKKPGAWWDPETINPMLALRVLRQNEWWEAFCSDRRRARMPLAAA